MVGIGRSEIRHRPDHHYSDRAFEHTHCGSGSRFRSVAAFRSEATGHARSLLAIRGGRCAGRGQRCAIGAYRRDRAAGGDNRRQRSRRDEHPRRFISQALRAKCDARAPAVDSAPDDERRVQPDFHGPRPQGPDFHNRIRMLLRNACDRPGLSNGEDRTGADRARRRHGSLHHRRYDQRLGGVARAQHRHLPAVLKNADRA